MTAAPRPAAIQPDVELVSTTFEGTIAGTDVWNTVMWWTAGNTSDDQANLALNMANAVNDRFRTLWTDGLQVLNTSDTTYVAVTARTYRPGQTSASGQARIGGTLMAGSGDPSGPQSQCCVVSLGTDTAGKSGRGRLYFPATAALSALDDVHAFDTARVDSLITAFNAFVASMNAAAVATPLPNLVVRSLRQGQAHVVTRMKVDARPDSQEHRERQRIFYSAARTIDQGG